MRYSAWCTLMSAALCAGFCLGRCTGLPIAASFFGLAGYGGSWLGRVVAERRGWMQRERW